MIDHDNYRAVKQYLEFKAEVQLRDPLTINLMYVQLKLVLRWLDDQSFTRAPAKRPVLPKWIAQLEVVRKPGTPVSSSWVKDVCATARAFFTWLHLQDPIKHQAVSLAWIATLVPGRSPEDPPEERIVVTPEIVRELLAVEQDPDDFVLKRDKAAAAFLLLSGMRVTAFVSLPLKCVNIAERLIKQFPKDGVRTKNRRAATTSLLNIPDLLEAVADWDAHVHTLAGPDDVWYAPVYWSHLAESQKQRQLMAQNTKESTPHRAQALRRALKVLFHMAGRPYMHPHLFRHGHALYGLMHAASPAEFKAVSMNLMHSNMGITDGIYGILPITDVKALLETLGLNVKGSDLIPSEAIDQLAVQLLQRMAQLKE